MFTGSRTESPACTQSGVTRCGLSASYDASTPKMPTYSFPSAADLSTSTGLSSASGKPPRCHSQSTRTCFAMPVGSSSLTMATTRGPCSTTSATRTSTTRSGTPKWHPTASRTFGGATEACTCCAQSGQSAVRGSKSTRPSTIPPHCSRSFGGDTSNRPRSIMRSTKACNHSLISSGSAIAARLSVCVGTPHR